MRFERLFSPFSYIFPDDCHPSRKSISHLETEWHYVESAIWKLINKLCTTGQQPCASCVIHVHKCYDLDGLTSDFVLGCAFFIPIDSATGINVMTITSTVIVRPTLILKFKLRLSIIMFPLFCFFRDFHKRQNVGDLSVVETLLFIVQAFWNGFLRISFGYHYYY